MLVGDILSQTDIASKVGGKKVIISKQAMQRDVDSRVQEADFIEDESNYYFFPKQQEEKAFIQMISQYTLNFSIEERNLEDYYRALI